MDISQDCVDLVKEFEGFSSKPYQCSAGKWTIGYGSTFLGDGTAVNKKTEPLSEQEAEELLVGVLIRFAEKVESMLTVEVTQAQFDALVCFAYNVGVGALSGSTLLKKVNAGDDTASGEFLKWDKFKNPKTGKLEPLAGLTRRRKAEKELFER